MNRKYVIELTEEERLHLIETIDDQATPKSIRKRCNVLLLADNSVGKPMIQDEIATRVGISDVCVYQTIKGYCLSGLAYVLRRRKHEEPPRKPIVTGEGEARIIALACGEPPDGFSRWTVRLLAKRIVELEIIPSIGRETVRTILKKRNLSLT